MKHFILTSLLSILFLNINVAQEDFHASVSNDSILLGNSFTIEFTIENTQGKLEAPDFEGCLVLSGPNMMSSMQSINGQHTSSISYTYIIEPIEAGELIIDKAYFDTDEFTYETDFITVNVYPNPDGIIQENQGSKNGFDFNFSFGQPFKKKTLPKNTEKEKINKKYKLKKI